MAGFGELLLGILLGLAAAAAINLAIRQWRGQPRREHELRHRVRQLGAAGLVILLVVGLGAVTYNPHWARRSHLSGTLAALQLFPGDLRDYYAQRTKALDVFDAIAVIQSNLEQHVAVGTVPDAAYSIMFISDMHLASNYPMVMRYAESFGVDLIINTGDESEFGTRAEMTPAYLDQLRAVTAATPMIWLAGNHDSPATIAVMRKIPGVTVLGRKTGDGGCVPRRCAGDERVRPDGRGGPRPAGVRRAGRVRRRADSPAVLPLERNAIDDALSGRGARPEARHLRDARAGRRRRGGQGLARPDPSDQLGPRARAEQGRPSCKAAGPSASSRARSERAASTTSAPTARPTGGVQHRVRRRRLPVHQDRAVPDQRHRADVT